MAQHRQKLSVFDLVHWTLLCFFQKRIGLFFFLNKTKGFAKSLVQQSLFPGGRVWFRSRASGMMDISEGYPCENCGRVYRHRGNMRRHMVYECGKAAKFQCAHCRRRFHQLSNLKRHCDTQHKFVKNFMRSVQYINTWIASVDIFQQS